MTAPSQNGIAWIGDNPRKKPNGVLSSDSVASNNHANSNGVPNGVNGVDRPVCFGPVTDLESMVPSHWWKALFADEYYLKTDGDVVEDPDITREEIRLLSEYACLSEIFERPTARILDLCCGQGRHIIELARRYPNLTLMGHDLSPFLIGLARDRAECLEKKPTFTVGDCRRIPYDDDTFDLVLVMGNSFGYFDADESNAAVLVEIVRVMAPDAMLVLDLPNGTYMRENYSPRSWEWIDSNTFVCRERALSKDKRRLTSRELITSVDSGVLRDQFYQERLYSEEELLEILETVGLEKASDVLVANNSGQELSKRQQDLGMMACRMLVVGRKGRARDMRVDIDELNNVDN